MIKSFLFYFATLILLKEVNSIVIEDCGTTWTLEDVTLEGCPVDVEECEIRQNSTISVSIKALQVPPFISLDSTAYIYLIGSKFEVDVTPEPCDQWPCPFNSVGDLFYNATMQIEPKFPNRSGRLVLMGEFKDLDCMAFCVSIPIKLRTY